MGYDYLINAKLPLNLEDSEQILTFTIRPKYGVILQCALQRTSDRWFPPSPSLGSSAKSGNGRAAVVVALTNGRRRPSSSGFSHHCYFHSMMLCSYLPFLLLVYSFLNVKVKCRTQRSFVWHACKTDSKMGFLFLLQQILEWPTKVLVKCILTSTPPTLPLHTRPSSGATMLVP